jgi:glycerate kinase
MKCVIAPDSFKDSLGAAQVAQAIALGLRDVFPHAECVQCPMADGGEGTLDAVLAAVGGERRHSLVTGPLGQPVNASWGWLAETRTALIEMAEASGLQRVPLHQRNACLSTTRGTGELISLAVDLGATTVVLTVGGSATNDGGRGMLEALGARFVDDRGAALAPGGLALQALAGIDLSHWDSRLAVVTFEVAADVDNPLCGPHGATYTFGTQKGASPDQQAALEQALAQYADLTAATVGQDHRDRPGAGAAGGTGFAAMAYLGAHFRPGVEVVAELTHLAKHMRGAQWVITGEGRFDAQTLRGKTPLGVARVASQHGVPVIVLAGTLGEGYADLYQQGIDAAFSLADGPMTLEEACRNAPRLLRERARDVARLMRLANKEGRLGT